MWWKYCPTAPECLQPYTFKLTDEQNTTAPFVHLAMPLRAMFRSLWRRFRQLKTQVILAELNNTEKIQNSVNLNNNTRNSRLANDVNSQSLANFKERLKHFCSNSHTTDDRRLCHLPLQLSWLTRGEILSNLLTYLLRHNKLTLILSHLPTLGQETKLVYSTVLPVILVAELTERSCRCEWTPVPKDPR